jgi:hypothetical protein
MKRRTEGPLNSQRHEKDRLIAKPKDLEPHMANNPLEASVRSGAPLEGPRADTFINHPFWGSPIYGNLHISSF